LDGSLLIVERHLVKKFACAGENSGWGGEASSEILLPVYAALGVTSDAPIELLHDKADPAPPDPWWTPDKAPEHYKAPYQHFIVNRRTTPGDGQNVYAYDHHLSPTFTDAPDVGFFDAPARHSAQVKWLFYHTAVERELIQKAAELKESLPEERFRSVMKLFNKFDRGQKGYVEPDDIQAFWNSRNDTYDKWWRMRADEALLNMALMDRNSDGKIRTLEFILFFGPMVDRQFQMWFVGVPGIHAEDKEPECWQYPPSLTL